MSDQADTQEEIKKLRAEFNEFRTEMNELLDIFRASKGFIKVAGRIGQLIKWAAGLGISVGALWYFLKTGHWPEH